MKKIFNFLILIIILTFCFTLITFAQEQGGPDQPGAINPGQIDPVILPNPLNPSGDAKNDPTPQTLIGKIINAALGIVGSLALLMFIYGGFTWMTAAGNEQSVTKGKDILIWATVGLIVIFSAYALVKFVFTGIGAG
jgi:hypothetical protein